MTGKNRGLIGSLARRRCSLLFCAACAAALFASGCASRPPSREITLSDNLRLYDLYDNERDWGPSFLVGPPAHHLGDELRIDDARALPPPTAAQAAVGPVLSAANMTLPERPLPPLP